MERLSGIFKTSNVKPEAYHSVALVLKKTDKHGQSFEKLYHFTVIPDGKGAHFIEEIEGDARKRLGPARPLEQALEHMKRQFALRLESLKTMAEHGYAALETICAPPSDQEFAWIPVRHDR